MKFLVEAHWILFDKESMKCICYKMQKYTLFKINIYCMS